MSIKIKHEDIPRDSEKTAEPAPRRSTQTRVHKQLFSPTTKGPYHKAVGFTESGGSSGSDVPQDEEFILTCLTKELKSLLTGKTMGISTNARVKQESESNLIGNKVLSGNLCDLKHIKARRGISLHGYKNPGVNHQPRNQVKKDPEKAMIRDMYQGVDYNTKNGFIDVNSLVVNCSAAFLGTKTMG